MCAGSDVFDIVEAGQVLLDFGVLYHFSFGKLSSIAKVAMTHVKPA